MSELNNLVKSYEKLNRLNFWQGFFNGISCGAAVILIGHLIGYWTDL